MVTAVSTAAAPALRHAEWRYLLLAYALVAGGAALGVGLWDWVDPKDFVPAPGVSVFALLYIFAQSIERTLEPFAAFVGDAPKDDRSSERIGKEEALALAKHASVSREDAHRIADQARKNRAVAMWAIASFLAMVASGALGVFLLRAVGLTSAPEWVDILVTGLAIGSGTKPLHDLISNIQKSKEAKEEA